ncbi:MAG: phage tail assembly chaperone [Pseudomonadota bacterium]
MLPWPDMLQAAIRMGLNPAEFWRLSLVEWRWLVAGHSDSGAMTPQGLDALMQSYPDTE